MSIELITQLIFSYAVECNDKNTSDKLWELLELIDRRGVKERNT